MLCQIWRFCFYRSLVLERNWNLRWVSARQGCTYGFWCLSPWFWIYDRLHNTARFIKSLCWLGFTNRCSCGILFSLTVSNSNFDQYAVAAHRTFTASLDLNGLCFCVESTSYFCRWFCFWWWSLCHSKSRPHSGSTACRTQCRILNRTLRSLLFLLLALQALASS